MEINKNLLKMIDEYVDNNKMLLPKEYLTSMKQSISEGSASLEDQMDKLKDINEFHNEKGLKWIKHESTNRYIDPPADLIDKNNTVLVKIRVELSMDEEDSIYRAYVRNNNGTYDYHCQHDDCDLVKASVDDYIMGETLAEYEKSENEKTCKEIIKMVNDDGYKISDKCIGLIKSAIENGSENLESLKKAWETKKISINQENSIKKDNSFEMSM